MNIHYANYYFCDMLCWALCKQAWLLLVKVTLLFKFII